MRNVCVQNSNHASGVQKTVRTVQNSNHRCSKNSLDKYRIYRFQKNITTTGILTKNFDVGNYSTIYCKQIYDFF